MHNHTQSILSAWLQRRDETRWVLGVITQTEGSSYRKAGALMLISEWGQCLGLLSGGCLERSLLAEAKRVLAFGMPRDVTFDATGDDAWALGLGCGGSVAIRLLPLTAVNEDLLLVQLYAQLRDRQTVYYQLPLVDAQARAKLTVTANELPDGRAFRRGDYLWVPIEPQRHLLVFGAGVDTLPVARMAEALGWQLTLVDHRVSFANADSFPSSAQRLICEPEHPSVAARLVGVDAALVMTHNVALDGRALRQLARTAVGYIGLLGPAHRKAQVLATAALAEHQLPVPVHGPMGLDIGGELPESVALSVLAQCHQCLEQRRARTPTQSQVTEVAGRWQ